MKAIPYSTYVFFWELDVDHFQEFKNYSSTKVKENKKKSWRELVSQLNLTKNINRLLYLKYV